MESQTKPPNALVPANAIAVTDAEAIAELKRLAAVARAQQPPEPKKPTYPNIERRAEIEAIPLSAEEREAKEARAARYALAQQRAERDRRMGCLISQAGRRYADCELGTFATDRPAQRKAVELVENYCSSLLDAWESGGLLLYGPCGTGKDHLAFAVCRRLVEEQGRSVVWINGQSWFGEIRDAMDGEDRTEARIIGQLTKPDVLVVSDPLPPFGALTQHQATMLYRAIDYRYANAKPTIATVNVANDEEAEARMGVATWDRLCHGAWKVHCNWPSYRTPARS